ncbi:cilia- and flagella-associated protein 157 [Anabrus simplex]|uniref:cilia- and flagella-associated protein 157 n=1 Tax=Anabrus simplex TaxID=316456 RepID=UPI0035A28A66
MAKGKKGKKGGAKAKEVEVTDVVTEVEKELFQIQIADLTRKVERLKARCLELEVSNEELQKNYATLDEDRADIIAYLKRVTQQKSDEIEELEERIDALIKSRDAEVEMYQEKIAKMDHDFKIMHEHLTSDIKLLSGKLNALEEFRIQKDDLMKKFKQQEIDMQEQEERHKRTLYEIERKFVIGKDKLVKEMESRLVKLSADFRDATEIRIAATTHHAIRENIAISNELDLMLEMQNKLSEENKRMKEEDKKLKLQMELHKEERDITLAKNRHQIKLLNRLAREHESMQTRVARLEYGEKRAKELGIQLEHVNQMLENSLYHCRVLNQKLHAAGYEQNVLQLKIAEAHLKYDRLVIVIETAARAINDALEITEAPDVDEAVVKETQDSLLTRLLELMDTTTMEYMPLDEPSYVSFLVVLYSLLSVDVLSMIEQTNPSMKQASTELLKEV